MSDWYGGDVITNGIRTHYYRTGGDKPPLVLCHGATDNGMCWTRVARVLEADYDVIMPDARGHGLSEAPAGGYDSRERAADVAGLIEALGLGAPIVGGHSMGAGTTFNLAVYYPTLVSRAILEDPGFRPPEPATNDAARPGRPTGPRSWIDELKGLSREEIMAFGRKRSPTWDEVEFGPWADSKMQVSPAFLNAVRFPDGLTWMEGVPRLACPTLLVTADPDKGAIVTPEVAAEAQRLQPRLKVVRLSGAGHNIRREQFEGFVEAVRSFLAES